MALQGFCWLYAGFLQLQCMGSLFHWFLLLQSVGSRARAQQLWHMGLVALRHVGSQFPDQGSNLCPLRWQADSLPLGHQGSPHGPHSGSLMSVFRHTETVDQNFQPLWEVFGNDSVFYNLMLAFRNKVILLDTSKKKAFMPSCFQETNLGANGKMSVNRFLHC